MQTSSSRCLLQEILEQSSSAEQVKRLESSGRQPIPLSLTNLRQLYATASIVDDISLFHSGLEETLVPADATSATNSFEGIQVGDYVLGEEIGRGGMGVVYQSSAAQPESNSRVKDDSLTQHSHPAKILLASEAKHWLPAG